MAAMKENILEQQVNGGALFGQDKRGEIASNLYQLAQKVLRCSIEMYAKKTLGDWAKKELVEYLQKSNIDNNLRILQDEKEIEKLKEGRTKKIDFTICLAAIKAFVRRDSLNQSYADLNNVITSQKFEMEKLEESEKKEAAVKLLKKLYALRKSGEGKYKGESILDNQKNYEDVALDLLNINRRSDYAHYVDEYDPSESLEEDFESLRDWAYKIIAYINIIEQRYEYYALFDDYYARLTGKENFDKYKALVGECLEELYAIEFSQKRIKELAANWNEVIELLTADKELDAVQDYLNICSGINIVDSAILGLYTDYRQGNITDEDIDYEYFKLLYRLNPLMEMIYWKGESYSKEDFAAKVIKRIITAKDGGELRGRIYRSPNYEFTCGINLIKWSKEKLLSAYFAGIGDQNGKDKAEEMEGAIIDFCRVKNRSRSRTDEFRKVIKASVQLYFYMGKDFEFSYTIEKIKNDYPRSLRWNSRENACEALEKTKNFKSFQEIYDFVTYSCSSEYFKLWMEKAKCPGDTEMHFSSKQDVEKQEKTSEKKLQEVKDFYQAVGAEYSKNEWIRQEEMTLPAAGA